MKGPEVAALLGQNVLQVEELPARLQHALDLLRQPLMSPQGLVRKPVVKVDPGYIDSGKEDAMHCN